MDFKKQPPWRNALRRVAPAQNLKRENPGSSPKANWSFLSEKTVCEVPNLEQKGMPHTNHKGSKRLIKSPHHPSLMRAQRVHDERTDGNLGQSGKKNSQLWSNQGVWRSPQLPKNRDVCQWATGLSSLEIKYGVSPLLSCEMEEVRFLYFEFDMCMINWFRLCKEK